MRWILYLFLTLPSLLVSIIASGLLDYSLFEWYYIITKTFFTHDDYDLFPIIMAYYPFVLLPPIEYAIRKRRVKRTKGDDVKEFE